MKNEDMQDRINQALAAVMPRLQLPGVPRIVRLEGEPYEDTTGEASLKIRVIYANETTDKQVESSPRQAIRREVISSLEAHGLKEFPYFFFDREEHTHAEAGVF